MTLAPTATTAGPTLEVDHLGVEFATGSGWLRVTEDVDLKVAAGETLGLVGESGSGKTVTALALMGLLPRRSSRVTGSVRLAGTELHGLSTDELRALRGNEISMIFQEPMTSLNPAFSVGNQIAETYRVHRQVSHREARQRAVEMLDLVGIPDPHRRVKDYPHAFSGGMRQRAMIAMALACDPKLLIADEPTTALDVTIQAQVLELLRTLQKDLGMAVLFVTHDLGVVADICDRVVVMYAGQVVETAHVDDLFASPRHPYSEGLLASMPQVAAAGGRLRVIPGQVPVPGRLPPGCRFAPRCAYATEACRQSVPALEPVGEPVGSTATGPGRARCIRQGELVLAGNIWQPPAPPDPALDGPHANGKGPSPHPALLEVKNLGKAFPVRSGILRRVVGHVSAVDGIDLTIGEGETLGLVGESGSGKSTAARLILRLVEPTSGEVRFGGQDLTGLGPAELRRARRGLQIVFQDPYSSLDPRATVAETVGEPLEVHLGLRGQPRDDRIRLLLERVGLGGHTLSRYPYEFSGGQRQRIAIARALALDPSLLVCDEPVSALDVSTQSQVINLLSDLQDRFGIAILFIAHDLSVVRHISDRIAVMYLGRIVETGRAEEVYLRPAHPYTEALLSAIPVPDPAEQRRRRRIVLAGDIPSPLAVPAGCRFHTRCPYAMEVCREVDPDPTLTAAGTTVACHLHTKGGSQ